MNRITFEEGNKIISDFLGISYIESDIPYMKYHYSLEALKPVIQKIESLNWNNFSVASITQNELKISIGEIKISILQKINDKQYFYSINSFWNINHKENIIRKYNNTYEIVENVETAYWLAIIEFINFYRKYNQD